VRVISLQFLLSPLMVQYAVLSREMDFRSIAQAETVSELLAGASAIGLALAGFGVWALVAQLLVATAGTALVLWLKSSWRPRWHFDTRALRELFGFSSNLLGYAVLSTIARRAHDLLIGRFFGAKPLGLYSRAYATMLAPVTEVGSVIARVMFPTLSRMQEDPRQTKELYLKVVGLVALLTFPVMLGVAVLAEPFILLLYGQQWKGAATVLAIFCVVGAVHSITTTTTWLFKARGRTDWMFRWGLAAAVVIVASLVVGIRLGSIESVAMSYAVATVVILPYPQFYVVGRLIDMRPFDVARRVGGAALSASIMALAMWGVKHGASTVLSLGTTAVLCAAVGAFVYLTCLRVFKVQSYLELRALLRKQLYAWTGARDDQATPSERGPGSR
jgi:PST family polysaccharide transporter